MVQWLVQFVQDDDAATAVEYAVMLSLILAVVIGAISSFGGEANVWWGGIRDNLEATPFGSGGG